MSSQSSLSITTPTPAGTWRGAINSGLLYGGISLFIALVGFVGAFSDRDVIYEVISMGQALLLVAIFIGGFLIGKRTEEQSILSSVLHGATVGLIAGLIMAGYLILASNVNLRSILVNSSPDLLNVLSFGLGYLSGAVVLALIFTMVATLSSLISRANVTVRSALVTGIVSLLTVGILADFIGILISKGILKPVADLLFARSGLSVPGAIIVLVVSMGISFARPYIKQGTTPAITWLNQPGRAPIKYGGLAVVFVPLLLALPWMLQLYLSDVIDNVGLFILMGLGLNIVVGYAGLLDLGYVAFFAIGAYTTAVLTSPESSLGWVWSFWGALPVAMLTAGLAGVILGIPVLRMRGDYLAIVTLGFGEIIRILVLSEALKPYLGGSTGILDIPKPVFFGTTLKDAQYLYYIILAGCLIALYVSWRLSDSRIGRAWIAMREDEDVAEAMGINLVQYKLMAFASGAVFSGMSGAIFATKIGSVFPHSFNLLISINVLSLIIVGGLASMPGVFVGALILVGLPELLREFSEFRLLMYGATLVAMMLFKPEGFWPTKQRMRELRGQDQALPDEAGEPAVSNAAG
jgi:branched-chain amino acid transport system permease protein